MNNVLKTIASVPLLLLSLSAPAPAQDTGVKGADLDLLEAVRVVASRVEAIRGEKFPSPPVAVRAGRDARASASSRMEDVDLDARGRAWADLGLGAESAPGELARHLRRDLRLIALNRGGRRLLVDPSLLTPDDFFPGEEDGESTALILATGVRPDEPEVAHMLVHLLRDRRPATTTDALLANAALAEGEANLVAMRYLFGAMGLHDAALERGLRPEEVLDGALVPAVDEGVTATARQMIDYVYLDGYEIVADAFRRGGWKRVDRLIERVRTTRDLLHPDSGSPEPVREGAPPMVLPESFVLRDRDAVGEQGIVILISLLTGKDNLALQAGDGWAGDRLYRWEIEGSPREGVTAWETEWTSADAAADFEYAYRRGLDARHGSDAPAGESGFWRTGSDGRAIRMLRRDRSVLVLIGPLAFVDPPDAPSAGK